MGCGIFIVVEIVLHTVIVENKVPVGVFPCFGTVIAPGI